MNLPQIVYHGTHKPFELNKGIIWAAIDKKEAYGYGKIVYEFHLDLKNARIAILPFHRIELKGKKWLTHIAPTNIFDIIYYMNVVDWSPLKKQKSVYHQVLINTEFIKKMARSKIKAA